MIKEVESEEKFVSSVAGILLWSIFYTRLAIVSLNFTETAWQWYINAERSIGTSIKKLDIENFFVTSL